MYKNIFSRFPVQLLVFVSLLLPMTARSLPQHFQASMEQSAWRVASSNNHCSLSHDIPRFGTARFSQASGKRLQFEVETIQSPVAPQSARLVSVSPPWNFDGVERQLGYVEITNNKMPISMPGDIALRLYYELEQGRMPSLLFDDWADATDQVEVRLSPVQFRQVLAEFRACTKQLVYLDFEPLSENTIYFSTNSTALNLSMRKLLMQVAREYKQQPAAARIILGGHADERGSDDYNMTLSKKRAAFVARYLRSLGVPKQAIELRYFGESLPAVSAKNREAWDKNRRVTAWIASR